MDSVTKEFDEKDIIKAIKYARKLPNKFLSTDIVQIVRDLKN